MNVKRTVILLMCLCAAMSEAARAEGRVCVSTETTDALLATDGSEVIAPGIYADIFPVIDGERYALGVETEYGTRYALGDNSGTALTDAVFGMLGGLNGEIVFAQNDLFGVMSADGSIAVPAEYTQLIPAGGGTYLVTTADPFDDDADGIFLLDGGETRFTGVRTTKGLTVFRDGRMPFQDPDTELYGYLAQDGTIAVEAKFETAGQFDNGRARASVDGGLGVIDPDGNWLIDPEYDYLEMSANACVALAGRELFVVYDGECRETLRLEGAGFEASLAGDYPILTKNGMTYVYDAAGEIMLEAEAGAAVRPGLNGQLILSDGDWGAECVSLVNADGAVSERKDQHLIALDGGRYAFMKMDAVGYYSEELEEIRYSCDYDSMRFGLMDSDGNEILPAEYLEIHALGCGRYLAIGKDEMKMTDADGNTLWSHIEEE